MRILVTGSEGNVGRRLVECLRRDHEVVGFDIVQGMDHVVGDIKNISDLVPVFKNFQPEVTYHLAAMVSRVVCEATPGLTIDTNISGTFNVVQMCKEFNSRLIHFSTSEVYGDIGGVLNEDRELKPNNIYGITKRISEEIVRYFLQDAIIVRPFMFYDEKENAGDHRSAMIRFVNNLLNNKSITVHTNTSRSWLHLEDGVRILEKLLYVKGPQTLNIGSNQLIETRVLAEKICDYIDIEYSLIKECPLPGRMTREKIPDISRQVQLTGIDKFISIEDGIKRVVDYLMIKKISPNT